MFSKIVKYQSFYEENDSKVRLTHNICWINVPLALNWDSLGRKKSLWNERSKADNRHKKHFFTNHWHMVGTL